MKERASLVTGASSGLGRAVTLELACQGKTILLLARDAARLEHVASEVRERGGQAIVVTADVTDRTKLRGAIEAALHHGEETLSLDLAVHAAGILELGSIAELSEEDWRRCLDINVVGSANLVAVVSEKLAATKGRLGLISSAAGALALPGGFSAYSASKWAVRGFAETVRPELSLRGVTLTVAYPSILDTPMVQSLESLPDLYRAFGWHCPEKMAKRFLRDIERGRPESWTTLLDRIGGWAMGFAPRLLTKGLAAFIRWRGQPRTTTPSS